VLLHILRSRGEGGALLRALTFEFWRLLWLLRIYFGFGFGGGAGE